MARYWEIRESYGNKGIAKSPEAKEAYECGYEEGYEAAMKEMQGHMGERSHYGMRSGMDESYGMRSEMGDYGMLGERRGRDAMGRYR